MLLIGGYTEPMGEDTPGHAKGISVYDFSPSDGGLRYLATQPAVNPSYLLTDRRRGLLYALRERGGREGAAVLAYRVERRKGNRVDFRPLGEVPLSGDHPCHLALAGDHLLVSSFTSGHVHVVGRDANGGLTEVLQDVALTATDPERGPRAHCTVHLPDSNRVLVCDLGDDRLKVFDRDAAGRLAERPELAAVLSERSGPRHVAVTPSGQWAVVNGECIGKVCLLDLREDAPRVVHTVNALPERVVDQASGAALRLGPRGKMVYCTDRNFSVIVTLRLDERAGKLVLRDTYPSGGESPRDLALSPKGDWLLTANTNDDSVGVFRVDPRGGLVHFRTIRKIPSPTTIAWL